MKTGLPCFFALTLLGALQTMSAAPIVIATANMSGATEVPPTGSPATGFTSLSLNGNLLTISVNFAGLTGGNASAAHIHCCVTPGTNAGVAVPFTGFPAATSGSYMNTVDLTSASVYTAAFIAANGGTATTAEAALLAGISGGLAYSNIHNATFPGGEIRGQLAPEPASVALIAAGLGALLLRRRFLAKYTIS